MLLLITFNNFHYFSYLVQDESASCRKAAGEVILVLSRRASLDIVNSLIEYAWKWMTHTPKEDGESVNQSHTKFEGKKPSDLQDAGGSDAMMSSQKRLLVRTGAQVADLLVKGRVDVFKKNKRVEQFTSSLGESLRSLVDQAQRSKVAREEATSETERETKPQNSYNESQEESVDTVAYAGSDEWTVIYHLLRFLETLMTHLETSTHKALRALLSPDSHLSLTDEAKDDVIESVHEALLYSHAWVRAASSRVIVCFLKYELKREAKSCKSALEGRSYFAFSNALYNLCRRLCVALNQQALGASLLTSLTQSISLVILLMWSRPDLAVYTPLPADHDILDICELQTEANLIEGARSTEDGGEQDVTADDTLTSTLEANTATRPSAERWLMQRLRGISADSRGRRRVYALRVSDIILPWSAP